jgi:hypothetical protein
VRRIEWIRRRTRYLSGRRRLILIPLVGALLFPTLSLGAAEPGWTALQIVNVGEFPWDDPARFGAKTKTFFHSDTGSFVYIRFRPTWDTEMPVDRLGPHYHIFHEWAYVLGGDYVIYEPVSPYQRNPPLYRFVEGTWLDRPAYSIHNGNWATGGVRAQNPNTMILFEEGNTGVTIVDPSKPSDTGADDWRAAEQFTRPWIVDSGSALEWEQDTQVEGRLLKWLSDDMKEGFRAQLVKIPPGWTAPEGTPRTYFERASRMRYVIYGDMLVWQFDGPEAEGTPVKVSENFYIHQSPRSIWGYGAAPVTEEGAVWLEVTYARGLQVGGGPIEESIAIQ